jgi:hypothetical protein
VPLFQASGVGNDLGNKPHKWLPIKGKVTVSDYFILVQFKFDDKALDFFKTKFVNSNARMPIGLEIDISPLNNDVFRKAGEVFGLKLPDEAGLFLDTSAFDGHPSYGAVIRNPHRLNPDETYAIVFYAKGAPWYAPWEYPKLVQESGDVILNFQVSVDKSIADSLISAYDNGDHQLNGYANDGNGGGFDYFVAKSDAFNTMNIPSQNRICWYAKQGDDIGCGAGNPFLDSIAESVKSSGGAISQDLVSSGTAIVSKGSAFIPSKGPGGAPAVTDSIESPPPDYAVNLAWLTTPWQKKAYTYGQPEKMQMHAQFENKGNGNGDCSKPVEVHFYRSKGYKEDDHSGSNAWKRVGTDFIQCDNIKPGMIHEEEEGIELWRDADIGISNIVACINHTQDDHNSVENGAYPEKHRSNNCSTEAVFEVTADGQVVNIPDVEFTAHSLRWQQAPSYAGDPARLGGYIKNVGTVTSPVDIRSSYSVQCPGTGTVYLTDDGTESPNLTPGKDNWEETKASVTMPNATGSCTAYLCADYQNAVTTENEDNNCATLSFTLQPRTFRWSSAGPISGMVCTQINEGAEPKKHTWNDNYFCANQDYGIRWNAAGPIGGMRCTQTIETADKHTWRDNYICLPPDSPITFYWNSSGPIAGKRCIQWTEPADPHTWNDNYLCTD